MALECVIYFLHPVFLGHLAEIFLCPPGSAAEQNILLNFHKNPPWSLNHLYLK
jgi:hypothetical protein